MDQNGYTKLYPLYDIEYIYTSVYFIILRAIPRWFRINSKKDIRNLLCGLWHYTPNIAVRNAY